MALAASTCGAEGRPSPNQPRQPTPQPTASAETMRFGYPAEPPTLDPLAAGGASSATRDILRPILPALFRLDERLKPQPELAAAWPGASDIAFDPFTVTVRLRAARWSDGKAITAKDVRYSWTKLRDGPTRHRYRYLRDVETSGATTVKLVFDRPVRRWWSLFSIDDMVLPAHAYSAKWKDGPTISGGPFAFDRWTRGLRIRLVRNDDYRETVPLKAIDVFFVASDETRLQLLERDELDAFFSESDSNLGRRANAYGFPPVGGGLAGEAGASGVWGPTWWELALDPAKTGTAVARAVVEAASPDLVAEILEDSGRVMNGIPPDFSAAGRRTAEPWRGRGSFEVARKVLDDGDVPKGSRRAQFQLGYANGGTGRGLATFLHFRLRDIGITAELVGVEPDTFERTFVTQRRTPVMLRLRRGADAADVGSYSSMFAHPGGAAVDDQVVGAETTVQPERVRAGPVAGVDGEAWAAAQRGLVKASTLAPLARVRSWIVGRDGVAGPRPTGASNGPLWNAGSWTID